MLDSMIIACGTPTPLLDLYALLFGANYLAYQGLVTQLHTGVVSKKGKSRVSSGPEGLLPHPGEVAPLAQKGNLTNFAQSTLGNHVNPLGEPGSSSGVIKRVPPTVGGAKELFSPAEFPPLAVSVVSPIINVSSSGDQLVASSKGLAPITLASTTSNSPSPECMSKLAARVKSIDGLIQLGRPSHPVNHSSRTPAIPLDSATSQLSALSPDSSLLGDKSLSVTSKSLETDHLVTINSEGLGKSQ